jgi:hypothetical protein
MRRLNSIDHEFGSAECDVDLAHKPNHSSLVGHITREYLDERAC